MIFCQRCGEPTYNGGDLCDDCVIVTAHRVEVLEREMRQIAQQVHQAYHTDIDGTWETCPRGVCQRARSVLEEVRLKEEPDGEEDDTDV